VVVSLTDPAADQQLLDRLGGPDLAPDGIDPVDGS
jgi:hypothetical protein